MERANVLIAGGGIVGSGVAWALARRGVNDIVVVDLDLAGVYASSELNAGGARATWWQPVNIATCAATLDFFRQHAEAFGFLAHGYLWLYDDASLFARARAAIAMQNAFGLGVEALEPGDVAQRFPVVDRHLEELVGATYSPRDGLVNPNAVRAWYRQQAVAEGVRFLNRHYLTGVETRLVKSALPGRREVTAVHVTEVIGGDPLDDEGVLRDILTTHRVPPERGLGEQRLACEALVNCLGAWSPIFSAKIGVRDVTEPVRRQICLIDVQPGPQTTVLDGLGMVVDPSGLYFHPEGGHILAGYSIPDEPPGFDFSYDGDAFFVEEIWPRLAHRASLFERCGHLRGWSGLYAVTPDRSGIAGAVDGFANLFEAHSFTGRGVMQSYGIATAMADIVVGEPPALDLSALSRERFADPSRWAKEDLHI